jgi:hypoxanthine-DNA glycosylase
MLQGLPPLIAANTRVLILGSFPGVRSLELQQYYAHPQNQFWRLVFAVLEEKAPETATPRDKTLSFSYENNSKRLLQAGVGLWDVYAACEREGSLDSAIRNAQLNDLASLHKHCPKLQAIAHNGGESYSHAKHTLPLGLPVYKLPSSSPAHASWSFDRKLAAWREALSPHL